jgi:hypothetical protein
LSPRCPENTTFDRWREKEKLKDEKKISDEKGNRGEWGELGSLHDIDGLVRDGGGAPVCCRGGLPSLHGATTRRVKTPTRLQSKSQHLSKEKIEDGTLSKKREKERLKEGKREQERRRRSPVGRTNRTGGRPEAGTPPLPMSTGMSSPSCTAPGQTPSARLPSRSLCSRSSDWCTKDCSQPALAGWPRWRRVGITEGLTTFPIIHSLLLKCYSLVMVPHVIFLKSRI